MTKTEARRVVVRLFDYFPTASTPPDRTLTLWVDAIVGAAYDDGMCAASALGTSSKYTPTLAELLAAIGDARTRRVHRQRDESTEPDVPSDWLERPPSDDLLGESEWRAEGAKRRGPILTPFTPGRMRSP